MDLKNLKNLLRKIIFRKKKQVVVQAFFTKDFFCDKKFEIGDFSYGCPTVLFENNETNLFIGKFCSIADNVTIFLGGNHRTDWITTYPFNALKCYFPEASNIKGHPATKGDVRIGNDVWIGRGVIIMSGVTISDGAVVGAGSVVSKNIGAYEIWAGNPAKFVKKRFCDDEIQSLLEIKWWDRPISEIAINMEYLCSNDLSKILKDL